MRTEAHSGESWLSAGRLARRGAELRCGAGRRNPRGDGRVGQIDPQSISSAIDAGAYQVLGASLQSDPALVLDAVDQAGLRGCGGAGFPTGRKWRLVREIETTPKYVVCNADESEPGAFKDRVLLENDPHLLLEGMALAGYAVGASTGIIYIRGEYEWIARRLERALLRQKSSVI